MSSAPSTYCRAPHAMCLPDDGAKHCRGLLISLLEEEFKSHNQTITITSW